jgi:superfamily II DNA or RNA helicase
MTADHEPSPSPTRGPSHRIPSPRSPTRRVPAAVAKRAIAKALLGARAQAQIGSVELLPHQVDAVARVRLVLAARRIALLADDVGMGKTFVALAVARGYPQVRILAPAALLPMWRDAVTRANCQHIQIDSIQRQSRASVPSVGSAIQRPTLVIIDEAHHIRNPDTQRYRAVAQLVAGQHVLLLSATPLHNSERDLRALMALVLGSAAHTLSPALLGDVIVRREGRGLRPTVVELPRIQVPHSATVLDAILALPNPLPAHDGTVAGALIRLGLLRAWCSSDAALHHALTRRLLRGEALQQALAEGRYPSASELRTWIVGDHEVQLAFPQLMAAHTPASDGLLQTLRAHLDAVNALRRRVREECRGDEVRTHALRTLVAEHPETPIIAFSQYAETVRAIGRALSDIAGVGVMTSNRATIASGTVARADALAAFAPIAQGKPPPPPHQRIRLLITTDLLAEGVNLQDAGIVVHLDLPWTDALRRQRIGRVVRVGSPHARVLVAQIAPPDITEAVLHLEARLQHKAQLAARLVGAVSHAASGGERDEHGRGDSIGGSSRGNKWSAAEIATQLRERLLRWASHTEAAVPPQRVVLTNATRERPATRGRHFARTRVSVVPSVRKGFLALVVRPAPSASSRERAVLVGGWLSSHASTRPRMQVLRTHGQLCALLDHASRSTDIDLSPGGDSTRTSAPWPDALERAARRAILGWLRRKSVQRSLADNHEGDASNSPTIHDRVRSALRRELQRATHAQRVALHERWQAAERAIAHARGAAAERALAEWIMARPAKTVKQLREERHAPHAHDSGYDWIDRWREFPVLLQLACATASGPRRQTAATPLVHSSRRRSRAIRVLLLLDDGA